MLDILFILSVLLIDLVLVNLLQNLLVCLGDAFQLGVDLDKLLDVQVLGEVFGSCLQVVPTLLNVNYVG